jgi:hypothetical protein
MLLRKYIWRTKRAGQVAYKEKKRNAYGALVEKPDGKRLL